MPYRKGNNWYFDWGKKINNPREFFRAEGLEEEYDRALEKYNDEVAGRVDHDDNGGKKYWPKDWDDYIGGSHYWGSEPR